MFLLLEKREKIFGLGPTGGIGIHVEHRSRFIREGSLKSVPPLFLSPIISLLLPRDGAP